MYGYVASAAARTLEIAIYGWTAWNYINGDLEVI